MHTNINTYIHTDRRTDRQTDRQTDIFRRTLQNYCFYGNHSLMVREGHKLISD